MEAEIIQFVQTSPLTVYALVFGVLLACGLGVPMPEDITLVAGGYSVYLAGQHHLAHPALLPMIAVGMLGVLSGDATLFLTGRYLGPRVTKVWPFRRLISPARMDRVHRYFARHGLWTAFFARFAAGLRAPTYLLAGTARMRFRTFVAADGAAAMISVPLLVWLAWRFGAQIDRVKGWLANSKYAIGAVLAGLAIYVVIKTIRRRRARKRAALAAKAAEAAAKQRDDEAARPPDVLGEN